METKAEYILEIKNITQSFPGVKALDNVSFNIRKGTVHGLMGENGAGKSTLMKILTGVNTPDSGQILFKGKPLKFSSITDAINSGISMIYQELNSILDMTVAENIFLGREPISNKAFIDDNQLNNQTKELLDRLKMDINPKDKMRDLSVAKMQMVEIAKAVSYKAQLIIMDEPTSAISLKEVKQLFDIIAKLKAREVTIIYITHKMDEVFKITDDITVLRDGRYVGTDLSENLDQDKLISMMVGGNVKNFYPRECNLSNDIDKNEVVMSVRNFSNGKTFNNVSFDIRSGEILGFAGLMGAGRSEVLESIFGITKHTEGELYIHGKKVNIKSPEDAIKLGIGFLTEDRKITGCFLPLSIKENMIMCSINQFIPNIFIKRNKVKEKCEEFKNALAIKTPDFERQLLDLSGGNQQKVLIARWLMRNLNIIIVDEPTRGIDVNAKAEIHNLLCNLAAEGKAILMVSSELSEILGMSDRVVVMQEGHVKGELSRKEATREKIMHLAFIDDKEEF